MNFVDLHIHLLYDVDDGAESEEHMQEILDAAYADGTRIICATPHFHPGYFGDNREKTKEAFIKLHNLAKNYKNLQVFLGNELRFSPECVEWMEKGLCRTLNGTQYFLVDFLENDDADYIVSSVLKVLNAGYTPVLAHAERYEKFHSDFREIKYLKQCGVVIQIDAQSPFGGWGKGSKKRSRKIIEAYLADFVGSDAHNVTDRPPQMSDCYKYVVHSCGEQYARKLFWDNPIKILKDEEL